MKQQIELVASQRREVECTEAMAAELQQTGLVRAELGSRRGTFALHPGSSIAVVAGTDWELRIDSHLEVHRLMFLLSYARDPSGWKDVTAQFGTSDSLFSSIAHGFAAATEHALLRGILRGYRRMEERSPVLRGRLRVEAQIARGGLVTPVDIVRDEYDADIIENQMLLAAARMLRQLPLLGPQIRQRLRRIEQDLDGVTLVADHRRLATPPVTRLNRHYRPALVLADIVLRRMSMRPQHGAASSATFRFELHRVFEHFLATALRSRLANRGARLTEQVTGQYLDEERHLPLIPDLVVWKDGRCHAVIDAKFKLLDKGLGGDAYQLLAYLLEFGPRRGFLVSATGTASEHHVRSAGRHLSVRPLDLAQEPEALLARVDALAEEILAA